MSVGSVPATAATADRPGPGRRSVADRLLGVIGGAMVLLAIVLFFVGGEEDGAAVPAVETPAIELVQPRHGATVRTQSLAVVFRVDGALVQQPGGWGTGSYHLHLDLDGTELMPAATDIERMSGDLYRWVLPRPGPGLHTLRLFWSGADHRPIQGSGSRTVQVQVEE